MSIKKLSLKTVQSQNMKKSFAQFATIFLPFSSTTQCDITDNKHLRMLMCAVLNSCNLMHASVKSFYGLNPINEPLVDFSFHFTSIETMLSFSLDVKSYCGLS